MTAGPIDAGRARREAGDLGRWSASRRPASIGRRSWPAPRGCGWTSCNRGNAPGPCPSRRTTRDSKAPSRRRPLADGIPRVGQAVHPLPLEHQEPMLHDVDLDHRQRRTGAEVNRLTARSKAGSSGRSTGGWPSGPPQKAPRGRPASEPRRAAGARFAGGGHIRLLEDAEPIPAGDVKRARVRPEADSEAAGTEPRPGPPAGADVDLPSRRTRTARPRRRASAEPPASRSEVLHELRPEPGRDEPPRRPPARPAGQRARNEAVGAIRAWSGGATADVPNGSIRVLRGASAFGEREKKPTITSRANLRRPADALVGMVANAPGLRTKRRPSCATAAMTAASCPAR